MNFKRLEAAVKDASLELSAAAARLANNDYTSLADLVRRAGIELFDALADVKEQAADEHEASISAQALAKLDGKHEVVLDSIRRTTKAVNEAAMKIDRRTACLARRKWVDMP